MRQASAAFSAHCCAFLWCQCKTSTQAYKPHGIKISNSLLLKSFDGSQSRNSGCSIGTSHDSSDEHNAGDTHFVTAPGKCGQHESTSEHSLLIGRAFKLTRRQLPKLGTSVVTEPSEPEHQVGAVESNSRICVASVLHLLSLSCLPGASDVVQATKQTWTQPWSLRPLLSKEAKCPVRGR